MAVRDPDAQMIPSPSSGQPTAKAPSRSGRAWAALARAGVVPEYEPNPAAAVLFQLAEVEREADDQAHARHVRAQRLDRLGTVTTLAALVLAAAAGVAGFADLVGPRPAGVIAVTAAVFSSVSTWAQSKTNGDALRVEAQVFRTYADDVQDRVVELVMHLPMTVLRLREQGGAALAHVREQDPGRKAS